MPACRQMSLTGTPASACLRIETIWVSVKRDFFMEPPGWGKHARKFYLWGVCGSGKLTQRSGREIRAAEQFWQITAAKQAAEDVSLAQDRVGRAEYCGQNCCGVEEPCHRHLTPELSRTAKRHRLE